MLIKYGVLPQANIYSSKLLFDKLEDRKQKRMVQIVKRKNALMSKNKNKNLNSITKSSEQMITPSTQDISNNYNNFSNISKLNLKEGNYNNKKISIERFLSSFKSQKEKRKPTYISNNFNIGNEDISEKEVNISNLNDNDNILDNLTEKEKIKNGNILKDKNNNKNNISRNNENEKKQKEKNNVCQRNKYAIEFLSSNLNSFVEFKNKLTTKVKHNKNYFTSSYSQALFLDYNNITNKIQGKQKNFDYEVNETIKEESESFSPNSSNKLYMRKTINFGNIKKKVIDKSIKTHTTKIANKSLNKFRDSYNVNNKKNNIFKFNKTGLINNYKLKISKNILSVEMKNKRKINESKENKKLLDIHHNDKQLKNKNIVSPKLVKYKLIFGDNNKKEKNNINTIKEKSKGIKKK